MDDGPEHISRTPGPVLAGQHVSHYVVERPLGAGGMGEVYLARDERLAREVALKRVSPELRGDPGFQQRLLEEANRAIRISDARIASVLDVIVDGDDLFLVLEYVPGVSLREHLGAPLPLRTFVELAIECTEAIVAAHRAGIVHHDIKPENFMVMPTGHVKLLDLGLATSALTPGSVGTPGPAGTLLYMAPEVLTGGQADERSDLFALGVVFYEMLAGSHPFRGPTPEVSRDHILHRSPDSALHRNPNAPCELAVLLCSLLAKAPSKRPASALDVLRELLDLRQHMRSTEDIPTLPMPPPQPRWRRPVLFAGVAGVLVACAWLVYPSSPGPMPQQPSVAILEFTAPGGTDSAQVLAAGLGDVVRRGLRRLTDPRAAGGLPGAESFRPIPRLAVASARRDADVQLGAALTRRGGNWHVMLSLRDGRDSVALRRRSLTVPYGDAMLLAQRVLEQSVQLLDLRFPLQHLPVAWRAGTRRPRAFAHDLAGLGWLELSAAPPGDPALLDSAAAAFRRAARIDSTDTCAWVGQAQALWRTHLQRPDPRLLHEAAACCQQALDVDLDCAEAYALLGELEVAQKRDPAAISDLERACELDPTDDAARVLLFNAYRRLGRITDMERTVRTAVERRPRMDYWHAWYGFFCLGQARYEDALAHYQQAVRLAPREAKHYAALGAVCLTQGRYQSAIPHLQTATRLTPSASNYTNLGTTYYMMRRFAAAESTYRRAIALRSDDCVLWDNLADLYDAQPGQHARAEQAYRQALLLARRRLSLAPDDPAMNARIAHYYAQVGAADSAGGKLQRALRLAPRDQEVLYKAVLVHQRMGHADSAFAALGRALAAGHSPLWVQDTPELDVLRKDARFEQFLRR